MTCMLADDEELARRLLADYIARARNLSLEAAFENGADALQYVRNTPVDLIFLDINMPDITGLELLRSMPHKPLAILTTAYSEYALEGFELDVVDYLQKPFSFERFLKAVNKAHEYHHPKPITSPTDDYFFVKADSKIVKVAVDEVLFIEGLKEYVRIHTLDKKIITLLSLSALEQKLPTSRFLRVHRSYIINYQHIDAYHNNTLEINGQNIPVGQSYKPQLMEILAQKGFF